MSNMSHEANALRSHALRAANAIYSVCFYSVAALSLTIILAGAVSMAVASNIVELPEFHSR
jgi:hypothetical protein